MAVKYVLLSVVETTVDGALEDRELRIIGILTEAPASGLYVAVPGDVFCDSAAGQALALVRVAYENGVPVGAEMDADANPDEEYVFPLDDAIGAYLYQSDAGSDSYSGDDGSYATASTVAPSEAGSALDDGDDAETDEPENPPMEPPGATA